MSTPMRPRRKKQREEEAGGIPPLPLLVGYLVFCAATAFVILGLTSYTYQLDDIKIPGLYIGGGLSLLTWAVLWGAGHVGAPPRIIWVSYAAYLAVCLLSILFGADFVRWIGYEFLGFYISSLGLVLLGSGIMRSRRMLELVLKFWVVITFVTTSFGLVHYSGLLEPIYNFLYPSRPAGGGRFHDLILTFMTNRSMLSTILNVQFFGVFLLMTMPVCAAALVMIFQNMRVRLEKGDPVAVPIVWTVVSGLCIVFSIACVFTTYSKSALTFLPVAVVGFAAGLYILAKVRRIPHMGLMLGLGAVMAATILFFTMGDLRRNFTNIDDSVGPRSIIYAGAVSIFADHPVLGSGPGSFRLVFPQYRSPDYHMIRISNVTLYAHNWILDLLAETGVLGAASYLAFLGGVFWLAFRVMRRSPDIGLRVAALGCAVGVTCILLGALLNPMTRWPVGMGSLHAMLGTMLGVGMLGLREEEPSAAPARLPAGFSIPPARLVLVAAAALFLLIVTRHSVNGFRAAILHNEGMKHSELQRGLFDERGGVREEYLPIVRQAADFYERSLAIRPASPTTYYKLAHVYNQLGRQERALDTYRRLQEYAPDYSEVHYNLAVMHYNLGEGKRAEASRVAREGLSGGRTPEEAAAARAEHERLTAEAMEHYESAIESFRRAAEMSNKISVHFFYASGVNLYAQLLPDGSEEARAYHREAGETFARASGLPLSGVVQQPGQHAMETEQRHSAMRMARDAFERAGEYALAAEQAARYHRRNPQSAPDLERAVSLYLRAEEPGQALALLDDALRLNPLHPGFQLLRLDTLFSAGHREEAREQGRFLIALDDRMSESGESFLGNAERERVLARLAEDSEGQGPEAGGDSS